LGTKDEEERVEGVVEESVEVRGEMG